MGVKRIRKWKVKVERGRLPWHVPHPGPPQPG
jgi:hypothetical protein